MPRDRPLAVLAGSIAQNARYGGHAWAFLQYLLGLRRIGFEVLFVDRLEPDMISGRWGRDPARSPQLRRLTSLLERFGLERSYAVLDGQGRAIAGLPRDLLLARVGRSEFLINVMGFLGDPEILAATQKRVFLDIDPGFPQMWRALGQADVFAGHDKFVTIGGRVGSPDCAVPDCGLPWIHTRPPVVLDQWPMQPVSAQGRRGFTTIGAWRGPMDAVQFEGESYGLRVHEFRLLSDLPARTGARFEAALDIDPADRRDIALLHGRGWRLLDANASTSDPLTYRRLIAGADAELMVAKGMYVRSRGGWFSDRSVCFLASGKPVLANDTGLASLYPLGRGLVTFDSLGGAVAGAQAILCDYDEHARAARALAEEWFDSDRVLTELVRAIGAP